MVFDDRADAGRRLATRLDHLRGEPVVVLGLPRGGVPVALEVARALDAPLDVILVRKLGVPFQPELGMGAIGEDGVRILNDEVLRATGVQPETVAQVESAEREELERRARRFRGNRPRESLAGRTAVIVDDGIATGSTARAACRVARSQGATKVVLAVPVAPHGWEARLGADADGLVSVSTPRAFYAIGQFYSDFSQVPDADVVECLARAGGPFEPGGRDEEVRVDVGPVTLDGHLVVPDQALGLVVFAHGSGSSRLSPRNRFVSEALHEGRLGTLLFDLLTEEEAAEPAHAFDIGLLAGRLLAVTAWVRRRLPAGVAIGYFGASTGAAAALWAAAEDGGVAAVVSRGGRPDLAGPRLALVAAPTLLIVGGTDRVVLEFNRHAQAALGGPSRLEVVPGAGHLFEEAGTLAAAAGLARAWFGEHLAS
jgi:putative phosphoribosyl transferase